MDIHRQIESCGQLQLTPQDLLLLLLKLLSLMVIQPDFPNGHKLARSGVDTMVCRMGNAVDQVQLLPPIVSGDGSGIKPQHLEKHPRMAVANLPHRRSLMRIHVGLDHHPHASVQRTLDRCFGIGP